MTHNQRPAGRHLALFHARRVPALLFRGGLIMSVVTSAAVFAVPALAAEGSVGTASVSGTTVRYRAAYKATNRVVITRSGRTVTIDDSRVIKPGKGCKRVKGDKTRVRCTTSKTPTGVRADLHDRNDSLVNRTDVPMSASGGTGNDSLTGGTGRDRLDGDNGADKIYGGAGSDRIDGSIGNDLLYGGAGHDEILGDWGHDTLSGGPGNDRLSGSTGNDRIYGEDGDDWADGSAGNDVLSGGNGDDLFLGGAGNDRAHGGNGADSLFGELGSDRLEGGSGNDDLTGDDPRQGAVSADVLLGGAGVDKVEYSRHTKPVTVDLDGAADDGQPGERDTVGADVEGIYGGAGNDRLTGNGANNYLNGMNGDDIVHGGAGDDELMDYDGRDKLYGEAGDDILVGYENSGRFAADLLDGGANGPAGDSCLYTPTDTLVGCETRQAWS